MTGRSMRITIIMAVLISLATWLPVHGQDEIEFTEISYTRYGETLNLDFAKATLQDTAYVLKSPLHFDAEDWKKAGAVAGITALLLIYDEDIQEWSQRNKLEKWYTEYEPDFSDDLAEWVKPLGDYDKMALPLGAFYLYGYFAHDTRARRTVLLTAETLIISNLIGQTMKRVIDRERPSGYGIYHEWGPPSNSVPDQSMPSGHAINAFAIATVFANQYEHRKWVPPVAYGLALLTGASRVHENRHWTSDVFVGACIGYFTAKAVLRRQGDNKFTITPVTDGSSVFVNFRYQF